MLVLEHPKDELSPSTSVSAECTVAKDPPSSHNEEDYGESITSSLFVHIFGDVIQSCQPKEPMSVSIDDIAKTLEDDPSIVASDAVISGHLVRFDFCSETAPFKFHDSKHY